MQCFSFGAAPCHLFGRVRIRRRPLASMAINCVAHSPGLTLLKSYHCSRRADDREQPVGRRDDPGAVAVWLLPRPGPRRLRRAQVRFPSCSSHVDATHTKTVPATWAPVSPSVRKCGARCHPCLRKNYTTILSGAVCLLPVLWAQIFEFRMFHRTFPTVPLLRSAVVPPADPLHAKLKTFADTGILFL